MTKKIKDVFARFNLTWNEINDKLIEARLINVANKISDCMQNPGKSYPLQIVYFAMSSLVLANVKNILEIGTGAGKSTLGLSRLFPKSMVYTIDIGKSDPNYPMGYRGSQRGPSAEERRLVFEKNMMANNIKFIEINSFFLPSLDLPEKFEIIFIDGDHKFPQVAGDIMFAYNRIQAGGYLFMHDYYVSEKSPTDVKKAVDWVGTRIKEKILLLPGNLRQSTGRMALIVKANG